ncbi:MAG: oligosaccharide flippase family protein [Clostridia bacterium]|nr:oligosaccharide flippase family protein [Clostridia bacterium]
MRKIFKAFATVTVISAITRGLSFVFKIYLSRKLGAEILGLYQICASVFMLFACICTSGLPVTLSRITAESDTVGDNKRQFGALTTCLFAGVLITLVMISAVLIFPQILNLIFKDERCRKLFLIMLPMLLTACLYAILRGWFWGKKYFGIYSISELADEILKILFAIIFLEGSVLAIQKEYAYALAMLAGDIIVVAIIIIMYVAKKGKLAKPTLGKEIAKSATPLTVTRIVGSLMSTFMSLILPSLLVTKLGMSQSMATADFGRASGMVMPLIFTPTSIIGSLSVVLIPEIASVKAGKGVKSLSGSLGNAILFGCLVSCVFFTLFSGAGNQLGDLLYDDPLSGEYLSFASIIMIPMCLNNLVVSMLNSMGKEFNTFISHVIGCVVLMIILLTTPALLGVKAYFVSLGAMHLTALAINLIVLNKNVKIHSKVALKSGICIIFSLGVAIVCKLASGALVGSNQIVVIITVFVISAVAFVPFAILSKMVKVNFKRFALKNKTTFL